MAKDLIEEVVDDIKNLGKKIKEDLEL